MKQLQAKRKRNTLEKMWRETYQKTLKIKGKYYHNLDFLHWIKQEF